MNFNSIEMIRVLVVEEEFRGIQSSDRPGLGSLIIIFHMVNRFGSPWHFAIWILENNIVA